MNSTGSGCSSQELTVAFALIGRDVAGELPYVLANIERLAAKFKRSHVVLVENDSADDTLAAFEKWAANARTNPRIGVLRAHSLPPGSGGKKNLRLLATARNKYIEMLLEPEFGDADFIIPVDTDMCVPWDVELQSTVINNLLPSFGAEWHVLFANGACDWSAERGARYYCDLFALRDVHGAQHATHDIVIAPGECDASTSSKLGCRMLNGEAVIPVQAAFGGWGMYWVGLLRNQSSTQLGCRYASTPADPCEHVPLSKCIRNVLHAKQLIASRLMVDWEGCSGAAQW